MKSKRYILSNFADEMSKDAENITNTDIDRWRIRQLEAGISQRTVNCRVAHVLAMFKYISEMGNPIALNLAMVRLARVDEPQRLWYTDETIGNVLNHCQDGREVMLISIAYEAGLRISELVSLKAEDFSGNRIEILGKGRKRRASYIRASTEMNLHIYLADYGIESGYIFRPLLSRRHRTLKDRQLSVDQARQIMSAAFKRAGVEKFSPHALRHSFATTMLKNGADIVEVQNLMGHKSVSTTSIYIHYVDTELANAHKRYMRKFA